MSITRYIYLALFVFVGTPAWSTSADADLSVLMTELVTFNFDSGEGPTGSQICVDITVENYEAVNAGLLTLSFDPTILDIVCPIDFASSDLLDVEPTAWDGVLFNCATAENGILSLLWFGNSVTVADGATFVTVCFDIIGEPGDCSPFSFISATADVSQEVDGLDVSTVPVINTGNIKVTSTEVTCRQGHCKASPGNADGSIYFWGVGGSAPYTFDVNGGFASGSLDEFEEFELDDLPAGMYTITITDSAGNSCMTTVNIFESGDYPMTLDLSANPTTCFDADNGTVRIDTIAGGVPVDFGSGGSLIYDIAWSTGVFNVDSLHRVQEGIYTVTVTDFFGCRQIDSVDISLDTLFVFVDVIQPPSCNGADDGIIVVSATGGVPGPGGVYDFSIEGIDPGNFFDDELTGVVSDTFFNIPNGIYEILVSDYAEIPCLSDVVIVSFDTGPEFTIDIVSDQDSCAGGTATLQFFPTVGGTYIPILTDTVTNTMVSTGNQAGVLTAILDPGIYNLSMEEFFTGCFTDTTFTVPDIEQLVVIVDADEPGCSGNDGRIELEVSGGSTPYTFEWNIDNLNGPIRENLGGGEYSVTITDANGCQDSLALTFPDGDSIPLDVFIVQAVSCSGAEDGIVGATVNNNTTYTYSWSDGSVDLGNTETIENLGSGTYYVTVADGDGCESTDSIFLANPDSDIAIDVTQTGPSCGNSADGNLSPIVNSGAGPFTFTWQDPDTEEVLLEGQVFTGGVGDYLLTIEDALGCSFDTLLTMQLPPNAIILTASNISPVSCFGTCDGEVTLEAITGTTGTQFIYVVNGGAPMNSSNPVTFTDICAGPAWALAVDATCISDTLFFEIPDQDVVGIDSLNTEVNSPSCPGDSDGSITLALEGVDVADATITWIDQGVTGPTITGLSAGVYEVEIAFGAGCLITDEITLVDPEALVAEVDLAVTRGVSCSNSTSGVVGFNVSGGNPGAFTYTWSPNVSTSEIATQVGPGLYEVTVTDSKGCTTTASHLLESAPPVVATIASPTPPACNGEQTCIEVLSASGGTGSSYTFTVVNGAIPQPIDTCLSVFADTYNISVFDSVGCQYDTTITITQPEELLVVAGPDQVLNVGEESEPISAQIVSFLPIDTISWSPSATVRSETEDNQVITAFPSQSTIYEVTVTDEAGCTATADVSVEVEFRRNVYFASGFSPNNDDINDFFQPVTGVGVAEVISFAVYDRWGNKIYQQESFVPDPVANTGWDGTRGGTPVQPGVYVYYAEVAFIDGVTIQYAGDVTIIR